MIRQHKKNGAEIGVIGYKPSYGDFDKSGILPNSPSIDTLGLMTRSVDDISLFRSILLEEDLVSIKKVDLKTIKVGFVKTPHWDKTDNSTKKSLEHFVNSLRSDKLNVIDLEIDNLISKSDLKLFVILDSVDETFDYLMNNMEKK